MPNVGDVTVGAWITGSVSGDLGEVISISGPTMDTDDVEITHTRSPNERKQYKPGYIDLGTITVELYLDETVDPTTLVKRQIETFDIYFSAGTAGTKWSFTGYIKGYSPVMRRGEAMVTTLTIKLTEPV